MAAQLQDEFAASRSGIVGKVTAEEIIKLTPIIFPLSGQWLLDPNEVNGWGVLGPYDNTNSQDLGNVGAANLSRTSGGLVYPFDVRLKRFYAWHYNSNANAQAWGWVIFRQQKTAASNTVSTTYIVDEVADNGGAGPRDYGNTVTQLTDITIDQTIPAGEVLVLAVAAPTANTNNYYSRIMSGYLHIERV